jgi:acyl-CoA reductase-like NAD-dependent aldehyde dehydrogenase
MRTFGLFVDGSDLNTGLYDYFPYTEQLIVDRDKTRQCVRMLRSGKRNSNWEKYVFARYCIGEEETNSLALQAAHKAGLEFRRFPFYRRRRIYDDLHKLLLENREPFIELLITEGHPRKLAEWEFEGMEIGSRPETIDFFKQQIRREIGRSNEEILYWARKPDGVVCLSPPETQRQAIHTQLY